MVFVFICHFISVVLPLVNDLWQPFDTLGSWHFWNSKRFRKRKPRFHIKLNRVFGIINPRALTNRHSLDMTPSSLEFVFGNPDLLGRLKQLAIQDFSAENVLFYEKYRHLRLISAKVPHLRSIYPTRPGTRLTLFSNTIPRGNLGSILGQSIVVGTPKSPIRVLAARVVGQI
ncbi:hypothetical protein CLU79DRAFT_762159 [Phycomyces nitens]|nr:hypothetical protein CLU79DRAFT_762159 [Phycomyces nitens]